MQTLPENRTSRPSEEEEATTKMAMQSPHKNLAMQSPYDISCMRRYHFIRDIFSTIHSKLHKSSRTTKSHDKALTGNAITQIGAAMQSIIIAQSPKRPHGIWFLHRKNLAMQALPETGTAVAIAANWLHGRNLGVQTLPENRNSRPTSQEEEATTKMAMLCQNPCFLYLLQPLQRAFVRITSSSNCFVDDTAAATEVLIVSGV